MAQIIVDIGSNWAKHDNKEQNLNEAIRLITKAAECGADYVKFQMFTPQELYGKDKPEMDKYCLPRNWIPELETACMMNDVKFMCSAFSVDGYRFIDQFVDIHKVASAEALDDDIMEVVAGFNKPTLVSSGAKKLSYEGFYIPMECVGKYPASPLDYIAVLNKDTVAISDHTEPGDCTMAYLARLLRVKWLEVHFDTLDLTDELNLPDMPVSKTQQDIATYREILDAKPNSNRKKFAKQHGRKKTDKGFYRPIS